MDITDFNDKHYFFDKRCTIKYYEMAIMSSVTQRIIALNNEFIQASALKSELFDDQIYRKHPAYSKEFIKKAVNWHLYMNNISKLSYQFDPHINFKRFYSEKSFVPLDWLIIEQIFKDPKFINHEFK